MKKHYYTPESEMLTLSFEYTICSADNISNPGGGENLDILPDFDPWIF